MRLLLWVAICLGAVDFVRSDLEFNLNISRSFGGFFDNLFKLPPMVDVHEKNPSTEKPFTEHTSKQNPPKVNPTNKTPVNEILVPEFAIHIAEEPAGLIPRQYFCGTNFISTASSDIHRVITAQKPDEVTILEILLACSPSRLSQLQTEYQRQYHSILVHSLKNILTGELEKAVISWIIPREKYYAQEIYNALNGIGADEKVLIDTLCIFNNSAIKKIDATYSQLYYRNMRNDLNTMTSGSFGNLLRSCIQFRSTPSVKIIDPWRVIKNEEHFFETITEYSFPEIFQYAMDYHRRSGKYLESTIKEKYSGDLQRIFLNIVYYSKGEKEFFMRRLHQSLEGDMVDHHSLIRLAIMDKKVDYNEIRDLYKKQFKKDLDEVMTTKIASRNFRKFIQILFNRKQEIPDLDMPSTSW